MAGKDDSGAAPVNVRTAVKRKSDRELIVTRTFDAPAHIVLIYHAVFAGAALGLAALIVSFNAQLHALLRADMILWGLVFALLTVWVSVRRIWVLNWGPIQYLGERSYSLYLLHVLIIFAAKPLTNSVFHALEPALGGWAIAPSLIATYIPVAALASLTYALVEKPGMDYGKKLHAMLSRRTPATNRAATS